MANLRSLVLLMIPAIGLTTPVPAQQASPVKLLKSKRLCFELDTE